MPVGVPRPALRAVEFVAKLAHVSDDLTRKERDASVSAASAANGSPSDNEKRTCSTLCALSSAA